MPRRKKSRVYWRMQGGQLRAYGDFRDLGGGQEALIPENEKRATTDPIVAESLASKRVDQLREQQRDSVILGVRRRAGLKEYASEHLIKKKKISKATDRHLSDTEHRLNAATQFFGADRDLASIGVEHVQDFLTWLSDQGNGRGQSLSASTQRKYLSALQNLFRRAQG